MAARIVAMFGAALCVGTVWLAGDAVQGGAPDPDATRHRVAPPADAPFAVVELYTSEGCSSCPPAEELLGELAATARRDGSRILPLAFHVDYWNGLGWTDPYSDAAYSQRQTIYAGRFESRYTPQMVVNGAESFVGSDRSQARRSIAAALARPARVRVDAAVAATGKAGLRVDYRLAPAGPGAIVHVALVEDGLVNRVERGENRGRTLAHAAVVRFFADSEPDAAGTGRLDVAIAAAVVRANAALVLYVQSRRDHQVLGATRLELPPPTRTAAAR